MSLWHSLREGIGFRPSRSDRQRYANSPQWRDGRFRPTLARKDGSMLTAAMKFFFGGNQHRSPDAPIPVVARKRGDFDMPPTTGLRVTWLGHSTLLLEIAGQRILIDPVWSERASGFRSVGPRRFFPPLISLADLPPIDLVVLSHDHYDHLDESVVRELAARGIPFLAPLGVGTDLARWGIAASQCTELDWWESFRIGGITITATPARHFSSRGLLDHGQSLWCGFAFVSDRHRVYYAGDTAMQDEFIAIGERLGPFDLVMIEVGAYNALWADVHLGPEQAVRAHQLARGVVLLPIHWGMFDLALHGWTEPIERTLEAAMDAGIAVATPRPGESFELANGIPAERWWPDLPWQRAAEAPVRSSGVDHLFPAVNASGAAETAGRDAGDPLRTP
ncbi:MAG: MBL fold metallo-hydrolase [Gemmatimonadota bacterium]